ncbi:MAG: hypothetical protein ACE5HT_06315 [Gemmatimonadales bacterium]
MRAQEATGETVSVDSAAAIREALQRPPPKPPADAVNVVEFPFKIGLFPAKLAVQSAAGLAGLVTLPTPPLPVRLVRGLSQWGLTPRIRSIGPRSGAAIDLVLHRFDPLFFESGYSIRGSTLHRVGIAIGDPADRTGLFVAYSFRRDAQGNFWGIGKDSREEDRSDFRREKKEAVTRGWLALGPVKGLLGIGIENNRVDGGNDGSLPDLQATFALDPPFGSIGRTKFVRFELSSALGSVRRIGFRHTGILLSGGTEIFRGIDGTDSDFHRFNGEFRGYLPVSSSQTLAVRAIGALNVADGGSGIPFFHLVRLGGSGNGPRSFSSGRFRDKFGLSIQSEWRYGIWENISGRSRVEAFLIFDEGAVARSIDAFSVSDLRSSYGFGLRVAKHRGLAAGAYVVFGAEGSQIVAKSVWSF